MSQFGFETTGDEVVKVFKKQVEGRTFVITGCSTGGLGAQTAITLAAASPKALLLLGRTESKVAPVVQEIKTISPSTDVRFISCDLNSLELVRKTAAEINASVDKIDVLINNAGIMATPWEKTADGIESQFGSNHVGPFLLTNLLMPKLLAAAPGARIVNLSSDGYWVGEVRFDDWNFGDGENYNKWEAYGQSKTANILSAKGWVAKVGKKGVKAYSVHPGVISTNLGNHIKYEEWEPVAKMFHDRGFTDHDFLWKSLPQGCATTLVAALSPELDSTPGVWLDQCQPKEVQEYARSPANVEKLWALSEKLVGQKFEY